MSITIEVADSYFERRLNSNAWDNSDDITKSQALETAEMQIELINDIELVEATIYNRAILEQAIFLLRIGDEAETRLDLQAQGVKQVDIEGGISESYTSKEFLAPYVRTVLKKIEFLKNKAKDREYIIGDLI